MTLPNETQILRHSDDYLHSDVDNELVMINVNTGAYASLNSTAKAIWQLLEEPRSVASIVDILSSRYAIPRETCAAEVIPFIGKMMDRKMIVGD